MKVKKPFILLAAIVLVACSSNANLASSSLENSTSSLEPEVTSSEDANTSESSNEETSTSSEATSASSQEDSSSSSSTSSQETTNSVSFNFYNPTCGTPGTDRLNTVLKDYMNEIAGMSFVSDVSNVKCQIMANAPSDGFNRLTIGSGSAAGELEFTLAVAIKSVVVEAETYYQYYQNDNHPDAGSICYVNVDTNVINLAPNGNTSVVKEQEFAVNGKKVKLYNKASKNRAFIKTITFKY